MQATFACFSQNFIASSIILSNFGAPSNTGSERIVITLFLDSRLTCPKRFTLFPLKQFENGKTDSSGGQMLTEMDLTLEMLNSQAIQLKEIYLPS